MTAGAKESTVELAALDWLREAGYMVAAAREIDRASFADVVLRDRFQAALRRLNPDLPQSALDDAFASVLGVESRNLYENNRRFHRLLVEGVDVQYQRPDGSAAGAKVHLADFDNPANNDWLAVNQFTVLERSEDRAIPAADRRPDIVLFLNGLPIAVMELKSAAAEGATIQKAFKQLQTYKRTIPSLFTYNEALLVSDGTLARVGALTADWERFMPWRTIAGDVVAPKGTPELEVVIKGVFTPARFLDLIRHFIVFEVDGATIVKKMAGYHQFHAVNKAVASTLTASAQGGDRRIGVVWHTQGSGKSLSMAFYAGKIVQQPAMANPTIVVLTDRNDLDDQLFANFSADRDLLRQTPIQATNRAHMRDLLRVASGGVIFTTIQKFGPDEPGGDHRSLSDRRNIIVIADEAHRSQYEFVDGFAGYLRDALPHASFVGFTGTPIETADANTRAVFGDYIDIYDIHRSVEDGATVPIYYEGRLARIELDDRERPQIDAEFEEVTETEEVERKERLKSRWTRLEALVGAPQRINRVAEDIVTHFEQRQAALQGKAMIVCMSRRICVELYNAIIALRPDWHSDSDEEGTIKVVMTGNATDDLAFQPHIRSKVRREALALRFKNPDDRFEIVIVRDMWLTGFDAPALHTMYLDKPMRGHNLMQAIARVNRVFRDKPGGLIVDYLGLADVLRKALAYYSAADRLEAGIPQEQAVALLLEKYEVVKAICYGFDYSLYFTGTPAQRLTTIAQLVEHILAQRDGRERFVQAVADMSRAFALAVPAEEALALRDELAFFQAIRASFVKETLNEGRNTESLDTAIQQIISRAVAADGVVNIFDAAGLKTVDISIFSDAFLDEVKGLPQRNLALEILRKVLTDAIKQRAKSNVVQARSFEETLNEAIAQYHNRSLATADIIMELIALAQQMRAAQTRGEELGLTEEEVAFYDALADNESAVQVLGNDTLGVMARELAQTVRQNVTIDWTEKESVRAKLRVLVRRLLRKYGYPPDKQDQATQTVLEQAEALGKDWAV